MGTKFYAINMVTSIKEMSNYTQFSSSRAASRNRRRWQPSRLAVLVVCSYLLQPTAAMGALLGYAGSEIGKYLYEKGIESFTKNCPECNPIGDFLNINKECQTCKGDGELHFRDRDLKSAYKFITKNDEVSFYCVCNKTKSETGGDPNCTKCGGDGLEHAGDFISDLTSRYCPKCNPNGDFQNINKECNTCGGDGIEQIGERLSNGVSSWWNSKPKPAGPAIYECFRDRQWMPYSPEVSAKIAKLAKDESFEVTFGSSQFDIKCDETGSLTQVGKSGYGEGHARPIRKRAGRRLLVERLFRAEENPSR